MQRDQTKLNFTEATFKKLKPALKTGRAEWKIWRKSFYLEPSYLRRKETMKLYRKKSSTYSWSLKTKKTYSISSSLQLWTQLIWMKTVFSSENSSKLKDQQRSAPQQAETSFMLLTWITATYQLLTAWIKSTCLPEIIKFVDIYPLYLWL